LNVLVLLDPRLMDALGFLGVLKFLIYGETLAGHVVEIIDGLLMLFMWILGRGERCKDGG
jgi:hypothetical protein